MIESNGHHSPVNNIVNIKCSSVVGTFLNRVSSAMERLLERGLEANLLVTSIVARLSHYPHPVLRAYLLDPTITLPSPATPFQAVLKNVHWHLFPLFKKKKRNVLNDVCIKMAGSFLSLSLSLSFKFLQISDEARRKCRLMGLNNYREAMLLVRQQLSTQPTPTYQLLPPNQNFFFGLLPKLHNINIMLHLSLSATYYVSSSSFFFAFSSEEGAADENRRFLEALIVFEEFCKELAAILQASSLQPHEAEDHRQGHLSDGERSQEKFVS